MPAAPKHRSASAATAALGVAALALLPGACSSTSDIEGAPSRLPDIALSGSSVTPAHHMATYEYPFDSGGNYVTDWAAEGERRAGRSARATREDARRWSGSHGGSASSSRTTSGSSKPKTKSAGGTKYVVRKGDTVERIARRYGVSAKALMGANGLKSDLIRIGQTLRIPK